MSEASRTDQGNHERPLTRSTLFLLAGLSALGALATNIILPSLPSMGKDLGLTAPELALLLSGFFMPFAIGQVLVGPLSDRFGRRGIVLGGIILFVTGSLVCVFAEGLDALIIGRVFQGFGACASSVLSRAIARDLFDGPALARAMALTMIAMAAAPGFSPIIGSTLDSLLGWRMTFGFVALFGVILGIYYVTHAGETHPPERRTALSVPFVAAAYLRLALDGRFIFPALTVSLIIGGLYTLFTAAPLILMTGLGLTSHQLGLFFAATVFIVFGAGMLAPRLSKRWGQHAIGLLGILLTLAGGLVLFAFSSTISLAAYAIAVSIYLLGMGLINPLGTAIALHPFAAQAGLASALLGFLQMGCAALGSYWVSRLPLTPSASLAVILLSGSALALAVFLPAALKREA